MKEEQKPFVANIRVNVVVYKPKEDGQFDFALIDKASFSSQLSGTDNYECHKEIQKLLTETKETWPKLQNQASP
tara:strand:- start:452 stop:673 length:222 start_codon:yes stop_codon:yes gene_type:complete